MKRAKPGRPGRRGIYLISTLLLLTFLVIVGGAVMVSFQQGLASSGSFNNRQLALQAAMSGLQYVQARLETSVSAFSPGYAAPTSPVAYQTAGGDFQVIEASSGGEGINICGYINNANIPGASDLKFYCMFRVAFNTRYVGTNAHPDYWDFTSFDGRNWKNELNALPTYVSMNNLNMSSGMDSASFDPSGAVFQSIPGASADIIVEGLVVSPTGTILARRNVESIMTIGQIGGLAAAASSAGDMTFTINKSGGAVMVGTADPLSNFSDNAGLATLQSIHLYGQDAVSGNDVPNYSAVALASLTDTSTKTFKHTYNGTTTDVTGGDYNVTQQKTVNPPPIKASDVPDVRTGNVTVDAGLWVVWNGRLWHYPVEYQANDAQGDPIPLTLQPWSQTGTDPPKYNGVASDTPSGVAGMGSLPFDAATNQVTVTDQDVKVAPKPSSPTVRSFAFVVAPSAYGGNPATTQMALPDGGVDSSQVGSAQLTFAPSSGSNPPQFRSPGSLSVLGNVTGQGSLVTEGKDPANGATIPGDITVVGKSTLDSRSDAGVAIYAAGNMNMLQLSQAQAPPGLPAVSNTMRSRGITEGSGDTSTVSAYEFSSTQEAVYSALAQAMQGALATAGSKGADSNYGLYKGTGPLDSKPLLYYSKTKGAYAIAKQIKGQQVSVKMSTDDAPISGSLEQVLRKLLPDDERLESGDERVAEIGRLIFSPGMDSDGTVGNTGVTPMINGAESGTFTTTENSYTVYRDKQWITYTSCTSRIASTTLSNYTYDGTSEAAPAPSPSVTPTPSASPTPTPSDTTTVTTLDQTFSGLVYAQKNIKMVNQLGQITIDGAMAAYGGNPTGLPGNGGTGNVSIQGDNVRIMYDPAVLGPYATFFGGKVMLNRNCVTVF